MKDTAELLLRLVYEFAIDVIQDTKGTAAWASELERIASALKEDRRYKPDVSKIDW